ncbi:MAG: GNAT family N-acetyltransferase [Pseudoalteromonas spongiae]
MAEFTCQILNSMNEIDESLWQQCQNDEAASLFTSYRFLKLLETSGSACSQTGWIPSHLVIYQQKQVVAVMPLFVKLHSFGEYIFDWAWAEAYQKHQLEYYPKLLSASPFTPVAGERLLINKQYQDQSDEIFTIVSEQLKALANRFNAQMVQQLFNSHSQNEKFTELGWISRENVQYHWLNRDYQNFAQFLDVMTSRKRKTIVKERNAVTAAGIKIQTLMGCDIDEHIWQQFYQFYQLTYFKRSGHQGYLTLEFFKQLSLELPEQTLLKLAFDGDGLVAGALFFVDNNALYGRYWGCQQDYRFLHFELCYYQGIEYCIEHQLQCFNSGAQGEHKIKRGFEPVKTYANYLIFNPMFNDAIGDYLTREKSLNQQHITWAKQQLPFKVTSS